jgi:hypothetical protein
VVSVTPDLSRDCDIFPGQDTKEEYRLVVEAGTLGTEAHDVPQSRAIYHDIVIFPRLP